MPFSFSKIDSSIVYCRHTGPIRQDDRKQFRAFVCALKRDECLLIDLSTTPPLDNAQFFCQVRAMLPRTAFVGQPLPRMVCEGLPGNHYYMYPAQQFETEVEALRWLREGEHRPEPIAEAAR